MSKATNLLEAQVYAGGPVEVPPGYKLTEVGIIPDDWDQSSVGVEFMIQLGKMLDAAKNTGVPKSYVGNRAVQWGRVDLDALGTVAMTPVDLQRYRLKRGDLLVCEGGEVGRAAIWKAPIPECYYQKAIHRLRPKRGYNPFLMMCMLRLWTSEGRLANYVTQTSIAHLPKEKFQSVPLPVPSPPEQRAIARALEDADNVIDALHKLIAKKQALKRGATQQLLTGRTRLPGFMDEWVPTRISDVAICVAGGTPSTRIPTYWNGSVRWMSSGELHLKLVADVEGRITEAGLANSSARMLPPKSVLIGLAGQGRTRGTVAMSMVELSTNQSIAAVLPSPSFAPEYLYHNLDSRYEELRSMSSGEGGRGGLNLAIIRSIVVPRPPREEQRGIATILSDMDAEIAALKRRRDKMHAIKQGMMQALLTGRIRLTKPAA